jgi:hypothetical protein
MTERTSMPDTKTVDVTEAERLASLTIEILRSRVTEAVRYAEAYETYDLGVTGRTIVYDGQDYAPSDRRLPYGEHVYLHGTPEAWEAWSEAVNDALSSIEVPDGRTDSDTPEMWTVAWADGILFAYVPEYDASDHEDEA